MNHDDIDIDLTAVVHADLHLESLSDATALSTYSTASSATTASCPISSASSVMTANCTG